MDTVVELIIMRWKKFASIKKKAVVKNYKSYVFNVQNLNGLVGFLGNDLILFPWLFLKDLYNTTSNKKPK